MLSNRTHTRLQNGRTLFIICQSCFQTVRRPHRPHRFRILSGDQGAMNSSGCRTLVGVSQTPCLSRLPRIEDVWEPGSWSSLLRGVFVLKHRKCLHLTPCLHQRAKTRQSVSSRSAETDHVLGSLLSCCSTPRERFLRQSRQVAQTRRSLDAPPSEKVRRYWTGQQSMSFQ